MRQIIRTGRKSDVSQLSTAEWNKCEQTKTVARTRQMDVILGATSIFARSQIQSLLHTWTVNESEWNPSENKQKNGRKINAHCHVRMDSFLPASFWFCVSEKTPIFLFDIQPDMVPTLACKYVCMCDVCGIAWWFWGRYTRVRVVHAIEWLRAIFPCEIFNQWCACRQILCGLFSRSRDLFPLIPTRNIIIIIVVVDTNKSAFIIIYKPSPHWQRHLGNKGTTIVTLCTQKIVLLLLFDITISIFCVFKCIQNRMLFIYSVRLFHFVNFASLWYGELKATQNHEYEHRTN